MTIPIIIKKKKQNKQKKTPKRKKKYKRKKKTTRGAFPGGLLKEKSNAVIRHIYRRAGDKLKIIGVGGIFTAEDVYEKIKCGASAVQMITGWIYGGPFVIGKINREL